MPDSERAPDISRPDAVRLAAAFGVTLARAHPVATSTLEFAPPSRTLSIPLSGDSAPWLDAVAAFVGSADAWQLRVRSDGSLFPIALTRDSDGRTHFDGPDELATRVSGVTQHVLAQLRAAALLETLDLISDVEAARLAAWSGDDGDYPRGETVASVFSAIAAAHPERLAIEAEQSLTYAALADRVARLAAQLATLGVRAGDTVAVFLERSADQAAAPLAIMALGAVYAPLDPGYPTARLALMLELSGATAIVTTSAARPNLDAALSSRIAVLDIDGAMEASTALRPAPCGPESPAYVMYTSGSTGVPKGVVVPHRAILRLVRDQAFCTFSPGDRVLAYAPTAFDASTLELFGPLLNGGTVVMPPPGPADLGALASFLRTRRIDTAWLTAALFHALVDHAPEAFGGLRQLLAGGDVLSPTHVARALALLPPGGRFINGYGPTENTTFTACHVIEAGTALPESLSAVPIGRPIRSTQVWLVDPTPGHGPLVRVPSFGVGELVTGGDGVALGYRDQPELTAERFVTVPFAPGAVYRTGDLARFALDAGTTPPPLEFLGRRDQQVKIGGHRVELGEIEAALRTQPGVRDAVVLARNVAGSEDKTLHAWVVPMAGAPLEPHRLRVALSEVLPQAMVPSRLGVVDALPVTPNGKVARDQLPELLAGRPDLQTPFERPRPGLEAHVASAFEETLGFAPGAVSALDSFFDLGGTSLLAIHATSRLKQALGRPVPIVALFGSPTVRGLATRLSGAASASHAAPRDQKRHGDRTDIAIIGFAGRFPGAADVNALWTALLAGRELITFFGEDGSPGVHPDAPDRHDESYVAARGIVEDADHLDAPFFGLSPRQAEVMDPQHRLFMEVAWEALEHAGYAAPVAPGAVGVFGGSDYNTYRPRYVDQRPDLEAAFGALQIRFGNDKDYVPITTAHRLNLHGPAVSVHTACSTSLVAIVQAVNALRAHQCELAIAGGVNVVVPSRSGHVYSPGGMYSKDGHTRTFDQHASGTVFSDGCAIVTLRCLEDAEAAGDTIYAVIRGVGIDNDGAEKASFTAPSVSGQARCIAMALRDADVAPNDIDFVEAHGTGTPIGDPIEVAALTQAYAEVAAERGLPAPVGTCAIGSLKSNIGHLTAAAGGAGLIKAALSLHHRVLPKTLHITSPNPAIPFEESPFRVAAAPVSLAETQERPPRAGVSALGVGGTNAHVVLEAWRPPAGAPPPCRSDRRAQLLLLSAKSPAALDHATERLADALTDLDDAAFTLATGRAAFEHRRAVVVHSTPGDALPEGSDPAVACRTPDLDRARARRTLKERPGDRVRTGRAAGSPPVIALFPGQGSQTVDMGRQLYATEPVFRQAMDAVFAVLPALRPVLYPDGDQRVGAEERLRDTTWAQPALFAVEYALAQLTRSLGIEPAAYIGHSVGEFTAACLAGVMPLEDAVRLVALRGRLMAAMPPGKMLAVRQAASQLEPGLPASLSLACSNAPELAVVAGPEDAITAYAASLAAQNVRTTLLVTSHAFHSQMMDGVLPAFGDAVAAIASVLRPPDRPIFSTATGARLTDAEAIDPGYWTRHVRATVRYAEAVQSAVAHFDGEVPLWVECGPRATAATFTRQTLARLTPGKAGAVVTLLDLAPAMSEPDEHGDPPDSEHRTFLMGIGELWTRGSPLDGAALFAAERRRRIPLPTYPFERKRHFADRPIAPAAPSPSIPEAPTPMPSPATPAPAPAAATDAHRTRLRGELTALVADLSGLPEESLDPARRFADHGFDSLFLTQLAQDLSRRFGQKFAFRDLAEKFASVDALASHLASLLPAPVAAPPVLSPVATSPVSSAGAPAPALALPAIPTGAASQLLLGQIDLISQQLGLLRQVAAMTPAPAAPVVAPPAASPPEPGHAVSAPSLAALAAAVPPQKPTPTGDPRPTKVRKWTDLSDEQAGALRQLITDVSTRTAASKAHVDAHRARHADPRTAAGFSPVWKEMVYPLVVARSKGARLWDLDGNEYIDLLNGFGPNFLGHADPGVTAAVAAQLERGFEVGPQTPLAGEAAALVCQLTGMDRASFTCTGSEAVQAAIRCARTVTRRDAIVVFTRDYHGNFDEVLVRAVNTKAALKTLPSAPGIPKRAVSDVIVLEYGADASLDIIRQLAPELAAVVVEPVQSRRPELQPRAFLHELRSITRESGTVLVFDEVVTGFRCHPGGAQAHFGVDADLATYGKVVAGGMPIGIVAGRRPIIDTFDGGPWHFGDASGPEAGVTFFAGTFVRHPLAIAAVHATLTRLVNEGPALQERVSAHTAAFAKRANALFERFEAPYELPHFGSQLYLRNLDPSDLGVLFWYHLRLRGVHIQETFPSYFTVEHGSAEVDRLVQVFEESLEAMADGGFLPPSTSRRKTAKTVATSGISSTPPVPGARLGKDPSGRPAWYAPDPARPGQYVKVS